MMVVALIIASITLVSCDDDDDYYYGSPLVGTWQMVAPVGQFYNEFTFYANGSGSYYVEDYYGSDEYYIEWWTNGSALTVDFPDEMDTMYFTYRISGYSLYLYPSEGGEPWVYQLY